MCPSSTMERLVTTDFTETPSGPLTPHFFYRRFRKLHLNFTHCSWRENRVGPMSAKAKIQLRLLAYGKRKLFHCCRRVIVRMPAQSLSFCIEVSGGPSPTPPLEAVPVAPRGFFAKLGPLSVLSNLKNVQVRFRAVCPRTLSGGDGLGPRIAHPLRGPSLFKACGIALLAAWTGW